MKKILKAIWNVFRSNLVLKIMAILFAVVLWSYVVSETNPERIRDIANVDVRLVGEDMLASNQLAISRTQSDMIQSVNVKVAIRQSELKMLKELNAENVTATVDLSKISSPGEYTRKINAIMSNGRVIETSPSYVKLVISKYDTKTVPVTVKTIGRVPNGYHANEPIISPNVITVRGALTDVQMISSAVCTINLNGLKEGFNKSMDIDLLDDEGIIVDKTLFTDVPSVIVELKIQAKKTVPVDVASSIIDQENVAAGYEVADLTCVPEKVDIAGDPSALAGISSISLVPYSVSGKSASESVLLDYQPPEGISVLTGEKAQVFLTIREITKTKTYNDVSIDKRDLASGLRAKLTQTKVDVTVVAGLSRLSKLNRSEIVPYVDLNGLSPGTYTRDVLFEIPEGFSEDNFSASAGTVTVTVY